MNPSQSPGAGGGLLGSGRDHAPEWIRAADDVYMEMIHVLSADPAGVDDGSEPFGTALFACEPPRLGEHPPEDSGVALLDGRERINVLLGNDHEVHRRRWIDVVEG